jgi:plastocyanin
VTKPKPGLAVLVVSALSLSGCLGAPPWVDQGGLVVNDERAPRDTTVLYLESEKESRWTGWRWAPVDVMSDGASFRPPITAVQLGDRVRFVNRGAVAHRLFTLEPQGRRERLAEPASQSATLRISKPGANRFYCSLHPGESFVIFASPSPYFLVLGGEPVHRIDRIPAGSYRLSAWNEAGTRFLKAIEIRPGKATSHVVSPTSLR